MDIIFWNISASKNQMSQNQWLEKVKNELILMDISYL